MAMQAPWAFVFAALGVTYGGASSGVETHCIGSRAHSVLYSLDGDSLDTSKDVVVSMRPTPEIDDYCSDFLRAGAAGDKKGCVGANVDATCSAAAEDKPLHAPFDCSNCFFGATTDLFYSLNISGGELKGVEVGLRDTHLRGAVEVHGGAAGSTSKQGTLDLGKSFAINFKIANLIPIDVAVTLPAVLDYTLSASGTLDVTAGADLDVHLSDHFMKWTPEDGFTHANKTVTVTATPVLAASVAAKAALQLNVATGVHVEVDKVLSYHLDAKPTVAATVDIEKADKNVCETGDLGLDISHEADLHFTLFGMKHELAHWGPKELHSFTRHLDKCQQLSESTPTEVVV